MHKNLSPPSRARKLGKEHKNIHTRATPDRSWGREENIGTKHKNQTKGSGSKKSQVKARPDIMIQSQG